MENILILGVPILKHIRVVQQTEKESILIAKEICHSRLNVSFRIVHVLIGYFSEEYPTGHITLTKQCVNVDSTS